MGTLPKSRTMAHKIGRERGRRNLTRKRVAEQRRRGSGFFRDVPESEIESLWERIAAKYGVGEREKA